MMDEGRAVQSVAVFPIFQLDELEITFDHVASDDDVEKRAHVEDASFGSRLYIYT